MNRKVLYQFSAFHGVSLKYQFCGSVVRSAPWDCSYWVSGLRNFPHFVDREVPPLCSQRPLLIPFLIHMNPVLSLMSCVLNFFLQSVSTFETDVFTSRFPTKCFCAFHMHATFPAYLTLPDRPGEVLGDRYVSAV